MRQRASLRSLSGWLAAAPIGFYAVAAWHNRWVAEDAFIDLRVVANLHDGLGPVWNASERVEAYTSPLWVAILWLASAVASFVSLEWVAVTLGLLMAVAGLALGARGSLVLWRAAGHDRLAIPFGLVVLVVLPPMWQFATSGLETGLTFLWLGGCFWALARLARGRPRARRGRLVPRLTPVSATLAISAGPLVRPDLGVFSVGFVIALLVLTPRDRTLARLRILGWALVLPVAYELFRMGYFAALEPNTALAKEASLSDWTRGWSYFAKFVEPYWLYVPAALVALYLVVELQPDGHWPRPVAAVALATVASGLVHGLYVVRVGGDYIHARLLLPSLLGVLLPVALVVPRRTAFVGPATVLGVVVWALVCAATLRSDNDLFWRSRGMVTLHDYQADARARDGFALRALAERGRALVLRTPVTGPPLNVSGTPIATSPAPVVVGALTVGLLGYAAGPRVHIVDELGIADPLGARTRLGPLHIPRAGFGLRGPGPYLHSPARKVPGHEKYLPTEWVLARFAPPALARRSGVPLVSPTEVAAARRALACPTLRRLLRAVTAHLTLGRFLSNMGHSFSLTTLRFSAAPSQAEGELCMPD